MPYIQYCEQCGVQQVIAYPDEGGLLEGEWAKCDACGYVFQIGYSDQPGAKGSSIVEKLISQFNSAFTWRGSLGSYSLPALMMLIVFLAGAFTGDKLFWVFGLLIRKALRMAGVF